MSPKLPSPWLRDDLASCVWYPDAKIEIAFNEVRTLDGKSVGGDPLVLGQLGAIAKALQK